jgi:serine/threonine-protein kinase
MIFGTPEYMAPEQASGKHADLRADIYAVGIIMYEMFTGAVPFTGETFLGVLTKHLNEPAPLMNVVYPELNISPQLQAVIMRALVKDPAVRYQTMLEFAQAITGTPDAAALGYRPALSSVAEHSMSFVPHAPGAPTHQQFAPSTNPPPPPGTPTPDPAHAGHTPAKDTEAARAETLIGAEANTRPPSRSKGGLAIALAAIVALGGGGAWFMTKRSAGTSPTPETSAVLAAPPPVVPPPPSAAPVTSAESVNSAEARVAPTSSIRLEVATEPPGATLLKNGFQVCDTTPCEVLAAPAETLEFQALKGALKGTAKVLAQRDQKVTIKLIGGGGVVPKPAGPRMCEVEVDGLKILRACK